MRYCVIIMIFILSCGGHKTEISNIKEELTKLKKALSSIPTDGSISSGVSLEYLDSQLDGIQSQIQSVSDEVKLIEIPDYISVELLADSILNIVGSDDGDETAGLIIKKIEGLEKVVAENDLSIAKHARLLERVSSLESDINSIRRKDRSSTKEEGEVFSRELRVDFTEETESINIFREAKLQDGMYFVRLVTIEDLKSSAENELPSIQLDSRSAVPGTDDFYRGVVRFYKSSQNLSMYENRTIQPLLIDDANPEINLFNSNISGSLVLWVTGLK